MRKRRILVTGTDTGVGKSTVCAAILRAHPDAHYFKPVETGVSGEKSQEEELIRSYTGSWAKVDVAVRLRTPAAPLAAAEKEGVKISLPELDQYFIKLLSRTELLIVEGAGGIRVPITNEIDYLGLCQRWHLDVILVVGNRLGCLNHTFLTVEVLRHRGIPLLGWVLNHPYPEENEATRTNLHYLTRFLGPPLGVVPYPIPPNFRIALPEG